MPTINIFYSNPDYEAKLDTFARNARDYFAKELSCRDKSLHASEISIRLLPVKGSMIADVEIEMTAHAFKERVERQVEICLEIRNHIRKSLDLESVMVWLILPQLGHSWDEQ